MAICGHFLMRKLHQLTGVIPLGIFLLEHFYTNSKALGAESAGIAGRELYNRAVVELQTVPYLLFIEIFGIFLPLVFHGVYGLLITYEGRPNVVSYGYFRNWMYLLQRISGVILFFFIPFHVLNFRFGVIPWLNDKAVAEYPWMAFDIVSREFRNPVILAIYMVGIISTVYHFANGLWLFLVDWGVVIGPRAQRALGYICAAIGIMLTAVGINAALAFIR
jgi:succinate dehydrogenase / fumarate reductase cytochrome b subunit